MEFTAFQPLAGADQPAMQATFSWQESDVPPASLTWPVEPLRRIEAVPIKGIQVDGQIEELWSKAKPVRFTAAHQFKTRPGVLAWPDGSVRPDACRHRRHDAVPAGGGDG